MHVYANGLLGFHCLFSEKLIENGKMESKQAYVSEHIALGFHFAS